MPMTGAAGARAAAHPGAFHDLHGNPRIWYRLEGRRGWGSDAYTRTLRPELTS